MQMADFCFAWTSNPSHNRDNFRLHGTSHLFHGLDNHMEGNKMLTFLDLLLKNKWQEIMVKLKLLFS